VAAAVAGATDVVEADGAAGVIVPVDATRVSLCGWVAAAESAEEVLRASAPALPLAPYAFCAAVVDRRSVWGAGGEVCGWAFAAAELDARARVDVTGVCAAAEADVGAGDGSDERVAAESTAGEGASEVCRADDCGEAEAAAGTSGDRVGSSASTLGAADRTIGGGAASSSGAGAVKGFGGGARRGGTIRNPATAAAATIPTTISRDRVLFAGDSGALNLGALSLAPCLTARSAATCAA
jgi:hypothetical protein